MTLNSIQEYAEIMRKRYLKADKKEKSQILNEFVKVTGYHRKAAIRVLLRVTSLTTGRKGHPAIYGAILQPLKVIWEASGPAVLQTAAAFHARIGPGPQA